MNLKFKKLSDKAVMPVRVHKSDAGLDLTATKITTVINECGQLMLVYHTDLAVEIPEGYVGLLFPRSSIYKKSLQQANCVGVIDAGYRGEIMVVFKTTTDVVPAVYKEGDRFAQLVIVPIPEFEVEEAEELSPSDRDTNGFGSSDATTETTEEKNSSDTPEEATDEIPQVAETNTAE